MDLRWQSRGGFDGEDPGQPRRSRDSRYDAGIIAGANIGKRSCHKHTFFLGLLALIFWLVIPGILIGVGGILVCMFALPGGRSMPGNSSLGHCNEPGAYEVAAIYTLCNFAIGTVGGILARTLLKRATRGARSGCDMLRVFVFGGVSSARRHKAERIKEEYRKMKRDELDKAEKAVEKAQHTVDKHSERWMDKIDQRDLKDRTTSLHSTGQSSRPAHGSRRYQPSPGSFTGEELTLSDLGESQFTENTGYFEENGPGQPLGNMNSMPPPAQGHMPMGQQGPPMPPPPQVHMPMGRQGPIGMPPPPQAHMPMEQGQRPMLRRQEYGLQNLNHQEFDDYPDPVPVLGNGPGMPIAQPGPGFPGQNGPVQYPG